MSQITPQAPKKSYGKTNKNKGHNGERELATLFRETTIFTKCCTTRSSSRLLDSCKIDLDFIPLNLQSKVGTQKGMSPVKELKLMLEEMEKKLPKDHSRRNLPKLVVHKKPAKGKRTEFDNIVTMTLSDFIILFNKAYPKEEHGQNTNLPGKTGAEPELT